MCDRTDFAACRSVFSSSRGPFALIILAIFPLLGGCGRGASRLTRAAVEGEVRVDEFPLKSGIIRFVPVGATKGPVALTTIQDGHYAMPVSDGPVLGKHLIEIVATIADNPVADAVNIEEAWADYAKSSRSRPPEVVIPKRYNRNSILNVEVTAKGDNTFDFKLASR